MILRRIFLSQKKKMIYICKEVLTNHVPAVAVRHGVRALSIITRRKGCVGGNKLLTGIFKKSMDFLV